MIPRPGLRRPSTARRVLLLAAQFVLAVGGLLGTALPHPVPVAAAWMPGGAAVEPVLAAGAGGGCTLTAGAGGGILSACPDAEAYADFAASLQVAFESARGAASTSRLTVASSSPGATVLVNGLQAGLTPLDVTLPAGSYLVRVAKDGFVPVTRTVTISADAPGAVSATLEPTGGAQGSFEWVRAQTLIALAGGLFLIFRLFV